MVERRYCFSVCRQCGSGWMVGVMRRNENPPVGGKCSADCNAGLPGLVVDSVGNCRKKAAYGRLVVMLCHASQRGDLLELIGEQHAAAVVAKMRFIFCGNSVYKLPRYSAGCAPHSVTVLRPYAHILSLHARRKLLVCPRKVLAQLIPQPGCPPEPCPVLRLGRRDVGDDPDARHFGRWMWF